MDQVVLCPLEALFRHELLLVELLTRAKTGVHDLDIHIRLVPAETYEVACKCVDFDRAPHIQNEDLAAVSISACEQDKAHGFGNSHKIPDDVRVCDRHRSAVLDLFLKERNDGAVRAEDVSETHSDELRLNVLVNVSSAVLVCVLFAHMGVDLRDLVRFPRLDFSVKALDDHLAKALGGAHDVGGVDRLVRRDEDKALAAVDHRGVGGLVCANRVVLDRLAGAILHERHVLVRGGVVDDLRVVLFEHIEHLATVADRADQGVNLQFRVLVPELELYVVRVVFINIEDDEGLWFMGCHLTADLATDGAAASGDEDRLALYIMKDFVQVGLDRLSAQKVLDGHLLHFADRDIADHELVHAGQVLELAVGLLADVKEIAALLRCSAGDREIDLLDLVLLHILEDRIPAADDRDAFDVAAPLVGVVVDDAHDLVVNLAGSVDVAEDRLAAVAGADHHNAAGGIRVRVLVAQKQHKTVGKTDPYHKEELQHDADEIIRDRHAPAKYSDEDGVKRSRKGGRLKEQHEFRIARVLPDALIEPHSPEDHEAKHRIERGEPDPCVQIFF